ncbi:hypothetical protein SASPL_107044 [Salvia splendens]|uniref:DOG1 domain-containing protein n=1 Tax=Salvia splendens TaxID=180675 RepID=A0A8X8YFD0_SALSN|nr:hypothetical protein SASPL_107044 [Salvia splendens]
MMHPSSSSAIPGSFNISNDSSTYDLGELDQALFLYLDGQDHSTHDLKQNYGMRPPTLNIFPSQPMHVEPSATTSKPNSTGLVSPSTSGSKRSSEPSMELSNPKTNAASGKAVKREGNRKGPTSSSEQEGPKTPDPKTLRRLAQNREAARKSRLRKKASLRLLAYVQQLESSRVRLSQLEQEIQRARTQVINLKSMIAKSDVFHLVSGMWKTPAERCFMWMGGFRPSEVIKIIMRQVEALSEQQLMTICGVQQSTQEAEEGLSQGLESLTASLSETIASDSLTLPPNINTYMPQMALAINKLSTLEGFIRQADNLRHQTLHRLHQTLTTRQAARCFLAIAEYFHRLRALSSLWVDD